MPRRIGRFLKEVRLEMKRVTWPNRREVSGATWVVIVTVVTIALFIWIIDTLLMQSLHLVLK
ncbi:preprotein translocase subunit SecE [bacterium]|nr:preprotein translocase subunit SecE [bacterium]MBU4310149.1 preprotein translocase subunit SecE [bacterium]MBU4561051.1 preprotein translocase subunit SecE [bacterium]MCG2676030.1 preprotein translocase subunit SecE [bacterium]MCG2678090.1 preprotein translocase subunit SecE [bacterium]